MTDPSAYPRPAPLSAADASALLTNPGQWADVRGAFLAYDMIPVGERDGEWRFAGAAKSLGGAFACLVRFEETMWGVDAAAARAGLAETLGVPVLDVHPRLEDGWSGDLPYLDELRSYRVVFFGEGGAPHDYFALCILEVEPADAEPFFARKPETHPLPTWEEFLQREQQKGAEEAEGMP